MNLPDIAFVIDIETYDTRPTARVATIGIVAVDLVSGETVDFAHLLLSAQDQPFRTQSDDTMRWWAGQSNEARQAAFGTAAGRLPAVSALSELDGLIHRVCPRSAKTPRTFGVWGYGASFDIVVLESLYADLGMTLPWTYRQHRDLRTLYELAGVKLADFVEPGETPHNAIDDAKAEARAMIAALERLGHRFVPRDWALPEGAESVVAAEFAVA